MTTITQLPPPPSTDDPDNFDAEADAFVAALPAVITQMNQSNSEASGYAKNASDSAGLAAKSATDAGTAKSQAQGFRNEAQGFRNEAEGFKNDAQAAAASLTATSTTGQTIGAGSKTFLTQAGKAFTGQRLRIMNPLNNEQWMYGNVTSYSGTSLVVAIDDVNPATAGNVVANWLIGIGGEKGPKGSEGGITGGNLTGALNEWQSSFVPVSENPDIWSGLGNTVRITGNGVITGFPNAPQAGSRRTVVITGTVTLVASANLIVYGLNTGESIVVSNLDMLKVLAENSNNVFRIEIVKRNGTATRGGKQYMVVLTSGTTWTVDATSFEVEVQAGGQGGHAGFGGSRFAGNAGFAAVKRFVDATIGAIAIISIGGVGAPGTPSAAPGAGGATSFALSGFTTLSATFAGASGADIIYTPRPGANSPALIDSGGGEFTLYGQGGDSNNGFGAQMSPGVPGLPATGYGAGGGGGGGAGTGGCIIIRYVK